jgi:hypothetical protein
MVDELDSSYHFDLFRYQLLPLTQKIQLDLFRVYSVEELKARKNEFFSDVLGDLPKLEHRKIDIVQRLDMHEGDWFIFHIGAKKSLRRHKADFEAERLDDWPHVIVVVNNDPDLQLLAVSRNKKAFTSTAVVADMLCENLNRVLGQYCLHIEIEAMFEQKSFWSLVEQYRGEIRNVTFELVSPNMANISKTLEINLAQINKDTNSHRTDLSLNSGEGSALEINQDNNVINSLVDYASAGGGDILIRLRGMKKVIKTSKSIKQVSIEEVLLQNPTPQTLEIFKDLLK